MLMPWRVSRRRTLGQLERVTGSSMRASSKLPMDERPTRMTASGPQAARGAAGMTVEQLAEASNCSAGLIRSAEAGALLHVGLISRASCGLPPPFNDLRLI